MRKILFVIAAHVLAFSANAQVQEGKIVYERKVNMHKRLSAEQENMKNMIPEFNTSKVQLIFSGNESILTNVKEEQDIRETAGEGDGPRRFMRIGGGDDETYKNYATQTTIEQRELGPKKYIIQDSLRKQNWKLDESGETKTVKGYTCKKATAKASQGEVVAWYTEQISCPSGPDNFGGLPGMILEVNVSDGEIIFSPLEITDKTDKKLVKAPANGKKITRPEFQKMIEEQFGGNGGGPQIRIIRQ